MSTVTFKSVAHLYLGCQLDSGRDITLNARRLDEILNDERDSKPILRRLESMTEEERSDIFKIVFGRDFPATGRTVWHEEETHNTSKRWVLHSGVDRLGIQMHGDVWADCDLSHYKHNQHFITLYLLSKHFDLFNLIDSNQAIDAATLPA